MDSVNPSYPPYPPQAQGLYDPANEHDACGVGFIAHIKAQPRGVWATFSEIGAAIADMPVAMRKLGLMSLFQWAGMSGYWTYAVYSISRTVYGTADVHSSAFHTAVLTNGEVAAFYNAISFVTAFAMVPLVIIWLGLGDEAKVFLTWLVAVFPVIINAQIGVVLAPNTLLGFSDTRTRHAISWLLVSSP